MPDEKSNPIALLFYDLQGTDEELFAGHKKLFFEMPVSVKPLKVMGFVTWQNAKLSKNICIFITTLLFRVLFYSTLESLYLFPVKGFLGEFVKLVAGAGGRSGEAKDVAGTSSSYSCRI